MSKAVCIKGKGPGWMHYFTPGTQIEFEHGTNGFIKTQTRYGEAIEVTSVFLQYFKEVDEDEAVKEKKMKTSENNLRVVTDSVSVLTKTWDTCAICHAHGYDVLPNVSLMACHSCPIGRMREDMAKHINNCKHDEYIAYLHEYADNVGRLTNIAEQQVLPLTYEEWEEKHFGG